jgi:TRAP-type uncharacterized transport system fused permease subunit
MNMRFKASRYLNVDAVVTLCAVALSTFHLHAAIFGPPEELIFRAVHLGFVAVILFLRPPKPSQDIHLAVRLINIVLATTAAASIIYLLYD